MRKFRCKDERNRLFLATFNARLIYIQIYFKNLKDSKSQRGHKVKKICYENEKNVWFREQNANF